MNNYDYMESLKANYTTYKVKPYETMYDIAKKFGISLRDLMQLNNIGTNTPVYVGMILKVPGFVPPSTMPIEPPTLGIPENELHTVKRGESLYSIARMHGISVENLMSMNNLTSNLIYVGQKLRIPMKPQTLNTSTNVSPTGNMVYKVRPGENLKGLAGKFNTSVEALMQMNELPGEQISPGEEILIPKKINDSNMYDDTKLQEMALMYTAREGETLDAIAKKFGITLNNLKQTNNLTDNYLKKGQQLIIPQRVDNSYTRAIEPF